MYKLYENKYQEKIIIINHFVTHNLGSLGSRDFFDLLYRYLGEHIFLYNIIIKINNFNHKDYKLKAYTHMSYIHAVYNKYGVFEVFDYRYLKFPFYKYINKLMR